VSAKLGVKLAAPWIGRGMSDFTFFVPPGERSAGCGFGMVVRWAFEVE
jgi:hypothetical protein